MNHSTSYYFYNEEEIDRIDTFFGEMSETFVTTSNLQVNEKIEPNIF